MLPKVKMTMEQDGDYLWYHIRSKSLTAAMARATLLIEALGVDHQIDVEHYHKVSKKMKPRHEITVCVS